ncbi:putative SNAP25 homologous protein SNAP30 [Impatiens glandulifera]|uniref:putative SNAP25 homologous protein SNAP30 n=1 Tax=Impatiens glandulifera TaxID=253017 RepID=UPI001FB0F4DD|nr:putative SNAP25 homologous protein SNAP30 [Impatiens glandulifera]
MFGFLKSPAPAAGPEGGLQETKTGRRTASEPQLNVPDNIVEDNGAARRPTSNAARNRNKRDSEDLDSMSVQELENYAVNKSEDTTSSVNNCLRIAEDIRSDATRTLETLHQQGDQIQRTHMMAADMDKDLKKGEKLLGNLGGMFSFGWKPKKGKEITGPVITQDDNVKGKQNKEQREKLGLAPAPKGGRSAPVTPPNGQTTAMQKIEMEKQKQDDGLSDLSDILGDLKGMAEEMGGELDKQNHALDHLQGDIDELNSRVKGANQRAKHLLSK